MIKRIISCFLTLILILCLFSGCKKNTMEKFTDYSFEYFDTVTTIVGYENNREQFDIRCTEIKDLLSEYHSLYTIYNKYDEVNNLYTVNSVKNGAHSLLEVDTKIIDLLLFSKEMYDLTKGKTNIAMGSVLSMWHKYRTAGLNSVDKAELPPMDLLKNASFHTDINSVIIDKEKNTVLLNDPDMSLDVGAVAKGYAVECVADYLEKKGITGYLINVGGNVRAIGKRADGEDWRVGIENPDTQSDKAYIEYLEIENMSVVTSGNYQRFYVVDGKSYHHIIDPETLMPGDKYKSVSVICDDSGIADALSTALFLTEYQNGIELIESVNNAEAMWVLNDGTVKYSDGFKRFVSGADD